MQREPGTSALQTPWEECIVKLGAIHRGNYSANFVRCRAGAQLPLPWWLQMENRFASQKTAPGSGSWVSGGGSVMGAVVV